MAIKDIGQINVKIGAVEYLLHPSFACWCEVEDRCGAGVMKIARDISTGEIRAKQIIAILWGGVFGEAAARGVKPALSYSDFADACIEFGLQDLIQDAVTFFSKALVGRQKKTPMELAPNL